MLQNYPFSHHSAKGGLTETILADIATISKPVRKFLSTVFSQWWAILGRHNFTNMARFMSYNEQSLRNGYSRAFNFLAFNRGIVSRKCSEEMVLAFDPTFIRKSGHHTQGLGYFWSGLEKRMKHGLEIGCLAAVDVKNKTALHLESVQSLSLKQRQKKRITMMTFYCDFILKRIPELIQLSKYLAVDGYFMRKHFILPIVKAGLHIITKMRPDANLQYLYDKPQPKGRGRSRKYAGKVDWDEMDLTKWEKVSQSKGESIYYKVLYSRALKMNVGVIYHLYKSKAQTTYEILLCTDLKMTPEKIVKYYSLRFQVEFLIRDAKQSSGLEDCQARDSKKLNFHFNMSLTAITVAKAEHYLSVPIEKRGAFSLQDIKRQQHNRILTDFIFDHLGLDLKSKKIRSLYRTCSDFGRMVA